MNIIYFIAILLPLLFLGIVSFKKKAKLIYSNSKMSLLKSQIHNNLDGNKSANEQNELVETEIEIIKNIYRNQLIKAANINKEREVL
jgi:hypothetical protein